VAIPLRAMPELISNFRLADTLKFGWELSRDPLDLKLAKSTSSY
jgi:hypothetical protein